jgi:hypothetical protein
MSKTTYLFDLTDLDGPDVGLAFRRPPEFAVLPDFDLRRQYLTMARLAVSAIPVPRMRWIDTDPATLGTFVEPTTPIAVRSRGALSREFSLFRRIHPRRQNYTRGRTRISQRLTAT